VGQRSGIGNLPFGNSVKLIVGLLEIDNAVSLIVAHVAQQHNVITIPAARRYGDGVVPRQLDFAVHLSAIETTAGLPAIFPHELFIVESHLGTSTLAM
jgi:hypothetical protein